MLSDSVPRYGFHSTKIWIPHVPRYMAYICIFATSVVAIKVSFENVVSKKCLINTVLFTKLSLALYIPVNKLVSKGQPFFFNENLMVTGM